MLNFYAYKGCDTCRKARKWLLANAIEFEEIAIRETPPSVSELTFAYTFLGSNIRLLFNTSGVDYRQLRLKDTLPTMAESEAIELLSSNGNLVKRPFVSGNNKALVGFDPDTWAEALQN